MGFLKRLFGKSDRPAPAAFAKGQSGKVRESGPDAMRDPPDICVWGRTAVPSLLSYCFIIAGEIAAVGDRGRVDNEHSSQDPDRGRCAWDSRGVDCR